MFIFKSFPTTPYSVGSKTLDLTNIMLHSRVLDLAANKSAVFYEYDIKDTDRPDTLAYRYYGDSSYDWVLFVTNNMIDPTTDWPINESVFSTYIENKYGSMSKATQTVHSYYRIISPQKIVQSEIIKERAIQVDHETYLALADYERRALSVYEYEQEVNDKKRTIKILKKNYLARFVSDYERMFSK